MGPSYCLQRSLEPALPTEPSMWRLTLEAREMLEGSRWPQGTWSMQENDPWPWGTFTEVFLWASLFGSFHHKNTALHSRLLMGPRFLADSINSSDSTKGRGKKTRSWEIYRDLTLQKSELVVFSSSLLLLSRNTPWPTEQCVNLKCRLLWVDEPLCGGRGRVWGGLLVSPRHLKGRGC